MKRTLGPRDSRPPDRAIYTSDLSDEGSESARKGSNIDNAATLRKLNAALLELDKLKAERNSSQVQYRSLQLERDRLAQELEECRVNDRVVSRQGTELRGLEEENRRMKQALALAESERKDLTTRLQAVESERLSASRKLHTDSQSLFQAQRSRETLEGQVEQLRSQLQQYEAANRELALSKAQANRDLSRLDLDRKSILEQLEHCSRSQDQATVAVARDREERESVYLRHSRLLASVGIGERVKAAVRKRRAAGFASLRDHIFRKYRKTSGIALLDKVLYRRLKRLAQRRMLIWKDLCSRVLAEEHKSSLLQGHILSLAKQAKFAWWQALTYRSKVQVQAQTRRSRFQAAMERLDDLLSSQEQEKLVVKALLGWRNFQLRKKREKLSKAVEGMTAQTGELKAGLSHEQFSHHRSLQRKALSCLFRQSKEQIWSYFLSWKNYMFAYRANLPKLKRVVTIWSRSKQTMAVSTWKAVVSYSQLTDVVSESHTLAGRNLVLSETIADLSKVVQQKQTEQQESRERRLKMSLVLNWKLQIRAGLRLWARNALEDSSKVRAIYQLTGLAREYHLRWGWGSIGKAAGKRKARAVRSQREQTVLFMTARQAVKLSFAEWQQFYYSRKSAKSLIRRALMGTSVRGRRKGFSTWKAALHSYKEADLALSISQLDDANADLRENLTSTRADLAYTQSDFHSFTLTVKTQASWQMDKVVSRLQAGVAGKRFLQWKAKVQVRRQKQVKARRLLVFWARQTERKAINAWTLHTQIVLQTLHQAEVHSLQSDLRDQQKSYRALKDFSEDKIATQVGEIQTLNRNLGKTIGSYEKVRMKLCDLRVKVVPLRGICFEGWKRVLATTKKHMGLLVTILRQRVLKKSLFSVKIFAWNEAKREGNRRKIGLMLGKLKGWGLRTAHYVWKTQVRLGREADLMAALAREEEEKTRNAKNSALVKDNMSAEMMKRQVEHFEKKCLQEWRKAARKMRKLASISAFFHTSRRETSLKSTFSTLFRHSYSAKVHYRKCMRSLRYLSSHTLTSVFLSWKSQVKDVHYFTKTLQKSWDQHYQASISAGFEAVRGTAAVRGERRQWYGKLQGSLICRALVTLGKSNVAAGFSLWRGKTGYANRQESTIRSVILSQRKRALRGSYAVWVKLTSLHQQRDYLESHGPTARFSQHLQHKVNTLQELLDREGVDLKRSERFLLERESRGSALIQLKQQSGLVPAASKYFLLWKMVTYKKQRIVKTAKRMQAYRYKGDLLAGFQTWKSALPQLSTLKQSYSKHELATIVSQLEKDVERLSAEAQVMDQELQSRSSYCFLLERMARGGQNQALAHLSSVVQTPLRQAMHQWSSNLRAEMIERLREDLAQMRQELEYVATGFEEAKAENRALADENGELRKTTRDGIAFAEALEVAGDENREIREELIEQRLAVERLLEENKRLADRVRRLRGEEEEDGYGSSRSLKFKSLHF